MYSRTKLREVMTAQGRSNIWLADVTGYDAATIARYLSGAYPISDKFARLAAKHLGVPLHWLRDGEKAEAAA